VEEFKEPLLEFETYTPKVEISTPKVYKSYRENFYNPINDDEVKYYTSLKSEDALKTKTPKELNDLFAPALKEYKELKQYQKDGYFFSGSGSSFFRVKGV
ncbi:MAG: 4-(cytidine 5'-diphospho)-2-C-methyl-D-erythritol kinase, partial [Campylobacterales bacterium]